MKSAFRHKDYIGFTISVYITKWFCSISLGFLFWSCGVKFGHFKRNTNVSN